LAAVLGMVRKIGTVAETFFPRQVVFSSEYDDWITVAVDEETYDTSIEASMPQPSP